MDSLENAAFYAVLKSIKDVTVSTLDVQEALKPFRHYLRITNKINLIRSEDLVLNRKTWNQCIRGSKLIGGWKPKVFDLWILTEAQDTTKLYLSEILDFTCVSTQIFEFIKQSDTEFKYLRELSIGSRIVGYKDSFAYESLDAVIKQKLEKSLLKCPNIVELHINAFCDDDILTDIIGKHCQKLKSLKISTSPLDCPDKTRLTEEGIIDF